MNQTLERSWFNQHISQNQHPKRHPATPSRRPDDPRHDDNQTSTPSKTFKRWSQVLRMRCNIWSKVSGFWTSQSQEFLETKSLASENWNNASKRLKGVDQIEKIYHHILSMDPYTKSRIKSNLHLHGTIHKNPTETTVTRVFFLDVSFINSPKPAMLISPRTFRWVQLPWQWCFHIPKNAMGPAILRT